MELESLRRYKAIHGTRPSMAQGHGSRQFPLFISQRQAQGFLNHPESVPEAQEDQQASRVQGRHGV